MGVTAATKTFLGLSGPIRAMILLNLGSAMFGSNQVPQFCQPHNASSEILTLLDALLCPVFCSTGLHYTVPTAVQCITIMSWTELPLEILSMKLYLNFSQSGSCLPFAVHQLQ